MTDLKKFVKVKSLTNRHATGGIHHMWCTFHIYFEVFSTPTFHF